jgi:membrane fusion protein, multidrug efflux system
VNLPSFLHATERQVEVDTSDMLSSVKAFSLAISRSNCQRFAASPRLLVHFFPSPTFRHRHHSCRRAVVGAVGRHEVDAMKSPIVSGTVKKLVIPVVVVAAALLLLLGIHGQWNSQTSSSILQKTNDAYVTANQIPLSTRITGTVRSVDIGDYQSVRAGQPILELDDADYQATVDEAAAAIDAARAQLTANQNAKRAADSSIDSAKQAVAQAQAAAEATQAAIDAAQAQVAQAAAEYHRQETLLSVKAATHQQYEQALEARDASKAGLEAQRADLLRAQASIASSQAGLAAALQQRSELDANDAGLRAQIVAKTGALTVAKVNLGYTKIVAPSDGQVGKLQVHPGQLLGAGVEIVDFVQSGPWIEANYLETQLARVRPEDVADIAIDAYPAKHFRGHVSEIAPASGSATALLPPDNATGNFTKVVQRVPVKILFDDASDSTMLRPGLSAQVTIHTDQVRGSVPPAFGN